jgi:hypothetical protein
VLSAISVEPVDVEVELGLDSRRIPTFGLYSASQNCFTMLFVEGDTGVFTKRSDGRDLLLYDRHQDRTEPILRRVHGNGNRLESATEAQISQHRVIDKVKISRACN